MDRSDLAVRMKEYYEHIPRIRLMRRTPVAIRLDGRAFHTFTKGFDRPFDTILVESMQETTKYLCENIQGCVLGYTQSDEITLILVDYKTFYTDAWFDYEIQKLCSITASMCTRKFNQVFNEKVSELEYDLAVELEVYGETDWFKKYDKLLASYKTAKERGAEFDSRCFNIPREEVTNLVYWRQLDASRNSVQMVGQSFFSHAQLQNKTCSMIQDMLHDEFNVNWNDYPTHLKRGTCVIKKPFEFEVQSIEDPSKVTKEVYEKWAIDTEIPIFKGEGRNYIESLIQPNEV